MFDDVLTERVMILVALGIGRLRRLKTHVVPAKILKAVADLAKTLWPHGWTRSALAGQKTRRKRGKRLGFSGHLDAPLLTDDAAAETADRTRTRRGGTRRGAWSREDGPAKILFEAV